MMYLKAEDKLTESMIIIREKLMMILFIKYLISMLSKVESGMSKPRKSSLVDEPIQKIIVGVAGGSAAGKTTMC